MTASSRSRFRFLPALECLEDRLVPTVTYHGGALLPHVEVQGMYLGADWYYNSTDYNQTAQFESFNRFLPQSSYMDLLTQLGYGVGRGSTSPGTIDLLAVNKNYYLTDSTIRGEIQRFINAGSLQQPDANRLYVVYVEPGVAIMNDHDNNSTSVRDFAGYHAAFAGRTAGGYGADIHYAVIAYAGGFNANFPGLTPFGSMTLTASHEIAEAATDPNVNYRGLGWYDDYYGAEIGDINRYEALLNGYAVQSIINKLDTAYIPYGATTLRALDTATMTSSFASYSGLPDATHAWFRLYSDDIAGRAHQMGQTDDADILFAMPASSLLVSHPGQAVKAGALFALPAGSHSVSHAEERAAGDALFALFGADSSDAADLSRRAVKVDALFSQSGHHGAVFSAV
ncbi:MAG: hypothetical protein ACJ8FY_17400 [Gemmataceae bacterium]